MNLFFDFFPIILFFAAYKIYNIFIATAATIIASFLQVLYSRIKTGKFNKTHSISFIAILILGGATIFLHNELFIKWKPTAVYWILALIFMASSFGKKTLLQHLADSSIAISRSSWRKLNYSWVIFFALMGGINIFVAYNFDTNTWVNFKLFGALGLTMIFFLIQFLFIFKLVKANNHN